MSDIVFFDTHDISFDAIYRNIFTIFSKCKLAQNTPKFYSWSAYVNIFATKWLIYYYSGTDTEFCIPDHWVQAAVMVKIRTFKLNPDLFRTTF